MQKNLHRVSFYSDGEDVLLEGEAYCGRSPGAVICHPHPQFGGSMHNNVVSAMFEALIREGLSVLRFNFRGVGSSGGAYDNGEGEVDDVLGAVKHMAVECGCDSCIVAGYSFGAAMALKALDSAGAAGFVAVALPTEMGREYYRNLPVEVNLPSLIVSGDSDDISSMSSVPDIVSFASEPRRIVIPGCDHFFSSLESLNELCENVIGFVRHIEGGSS